MKRYMRQILVFVLAFAMLANPLLYTAKASSGWNPDLEDGSYEIGFLWDFLSWEMEKKDGEIVYDEFNLLNGALKVKEDKTGVSSKDDYDKAVSNMQDNMNTTVLSNDGMILKVPYDSSATQTYAQIDSVYNNGNTVTINLTRIGSMGFNHSQCVNVFYKYTAPIKAYYKVIEDRTKYKGETLIGITLPQKWEDVTATIKIDNSSYYNATLQEKGFNQIVKYNGGNISSGVESMKYTFPSFIELVVTPFDPFQQSQVNQYINYSDSRVGSIAMNYGYQNGDGQQIIADNIQIVNEAEKSIYNPVTGDTTTYNDWSYDYSNRSYNVTTTTGDTMNVTYGDENVTIRHGDTVYNINYITYVTPEPSEPETSEPDGNGGNNNGGDNGNGNGNNNNDNDDGGGLFDILGELLGSIIKAVSDLVTPVIEALVNAIVSIIGKVLEGLGAFVDMLLRFLLEIPKMFAGFTEFLTAVFPFMPDEFVTLIVFGLMLVIIASVVKRIIG